MSIAARAIRSILWMTAGSGFQAILGTISLAIMARELGAAAFGVASAAFATVAMCASVLSDALKQRETLEKRHIDGTFWATLTIASVMALLVIIEAPWLVKLFRAPASAQPVFMMVAACLPLAALAAVPTALLHRDLRFAEITRIEASASVLAIGIGVSLALNGFGVWSLIWMELTRRTVRVAGAFYATRWRPGFSGGPRAFSELASFNGQTLAVYAASYVDAVGPSILIGRFLGVEALGLYSVARRVYESLNGALIGPFTAVTLTSAARLQNDRPALASLLAGLYRTSGLISYPAFLGMIAIAPFAVPFALGDKWEAAILPMQLLLLIGLRTATGMYNAPIMRGVDKSHYFLTLVVLGALIQGAGIAIGAQWGMIGVCVACLVRTAATWPLGAFFIKNASTLSYKRQASSMGAAMGPAIGMALGVSMLSHLIPMGTPPLVAVGMLGAAGVALYITLIWIFAPALLRQTVAMVRALLQRDRTAVERLLQSSDEISMARTFNPSRPVSVQ